MKQAIFSALSWVFGRFNSGSWWQRILWGLVAVVLVVGLVLLVAQSQHLTEWFDQIPDAGKGVVVLGVFAFALLAALWGLHTTMRGEKEAEEKKKLAEENEQLKEELADKTAEIAQHDTRMAHLLDVESRTKLWQRPPAVPPPDFIPPAQRKTRFLTVLNLKGGVGKTTLTANIAAGLAAGPKPLRVLLVDVDFQGTLGVACVSPQMYQFQKLNDHFVHRLLQTATPDDGLLPKLKTGLAEVPTAQVILAADTLEQEEFQLQAQFFLDPAKDPRFRLRTHLHLPVVTNEYDLVVFDCPPRVTPSVVNALFCSDHVLIPTRLDAGSIDAVPRTIAWVKNFGPLCPATVLGVVVTHAGVVSKKLVKRDESAYEDLRGLLKLPVGSDAVFKAVIRTTPDAVNPADGVVAGTTARGRAVYAEFVAELRKRMSL